MPVRFPRFAQQCLGLMLLALCIAAGPVGQVDVSATLDPATARPGEKVMIHVHAKVKPGYHAQSHTPLDPSYIPFEVTLDPNPNLDFQPPQYPPGVNETYPALGTLNVYTGDVIIDVPAVVTAAATNGDTAISGKVRYQACTDSVCFPPKSPTFSVSLNITGGAAGASTAPAAQASQSPPVTPTEAAASGDTLFGFTLGSQAYALAFFGAFIVGILFNAMPCVLPVVPLKIMGFYEASQHNRGKCLGLGAVFSAGLIASFFVLGLLVVGFRVLDWGGLFQKPLFTAIIVIVLLAMAVSQFGFFTVNLPTSVYRFTPRHDTYVGNFLFGVLTAALSTPCTIGMFVALLAWSLKQPAAVGVLLVVMVGVGMAAPYFLLSAFPQVARRFPRTGPLGEIVKQVMAFLLLATALYFAWPFLDRVISVRTFWWLLFGVIAVGALFMIVRTRQMLRSPRAVTIAAVLAVVVTAPALYATVQLTRHPYTWQPYSDAALADAIAQHKPVLVDFTATWCGNCHWLEAFVLNKSAVADAVRRHDVLMLKADVTQDDAPGRELLGRLNPAGAIPLTAIYLPDQLTPRLLSGIYTVDQLVHALDAP